MKCILFQKNFTLKINKKNIKFTKDESIHTENSHKYSKNNFIKLVNKSGFKVLKYFADKKIILEFFIKSEVSFIMAQKDVGNKIPIYKLKDTDQVMKYYDEWGDGNKYDKDMVDWNYTGPKETTKVFSEFQKNKDAKIYDAGCGTGLVGVN